MKNNPEYFQAKQKELISAARIQDRYDLTTTNLIAPASPTPRRYIDIPLRHADIAEGLLDHRPYAGAEGFNQIEQIGVDVACQLFGAEHANIQPHSVSQANQAVYQGLLENGDRVLAMKFEDGGHLTHGLKKNFSGRFYDFDFYGVDGNGWLDYDAIKSQAEKFKPKLIVCGASSYPRTIDFKKLSNISKQVGAYLMADLSHPAGLIVGERFPQPFPYCDVVTLTLDKTMLGPHGGIILCRESLKDAIDKGVHPGVQSSVPLRRLYEMTQCLIDSGKPWFNDYISRVITNIKTFESVFQPYSGLMVTGGSDTHLMVLNTLNTFNLTGKTAETNLENIGILTNRQVVPGETLKPYIASGIRLGTSWITARGYTESESRTVAEIVLKNLENPDDQTLQEKSKKELTDLLFIPRGNDVWKDESIN
jgi:glycine hydroxymethyltransferase